MKNKFVFIFLCLLLILGIGIFILPQDEVSSKENRPLATNKSIQIRNLLDSIETVMKDQFYFRDYLTDIYYRIKVGINSLFGGENSFTVLSSEVTDIGDSYLINTCLGLDADGINSAASRGYNVNEVDLAYPDIKTYVYFPKRIEEMISLDGINNYGDQLYYSYLGQLNSEISTDYLKYDSIEAYKNYYFKSDFHWNIKGAYQGYTDIINMINQDFSIGEPKEIIEEIKYENEFYGNVANKIGKVSEPDYLSDYVLEDIEDFYYYDNGVLQDGYMYKDNYAENGVSGGVSDYDAYFATYNLMREYDFQDDSKPNILIFGDSFINPIQIWLASHFNKTIIIDLRSNDGSFSLSKTIEDYDIDIILICEMYNNMYINGNMYIPIN